VHAAHVLTSADTAYAVAHMRAEEGRRPPSERLFADPQASLFADAGQHAIEGTRLLLGLPNMVDSIRLRTRGLDDVVRDRLAAGVTQIVLLGAGFDCRGLRMPEIPAHGARVYEVDFPRQLDHKRAILARGGVAVPPWIEHVGCDLSVPGFEDALAADLEAHGFRLGDGALVVMEGLSPYIDNAALERTLRFAIRAAGPGSTVTFDLASARFDGDPTEPWIRKIGFTRWEEVGFDDLWRRHLPGDPHPNTAYFSIGLATV
jgi:methyltransferase (TIGR00027 family)